MFTKPLPCWVPSSGPSGGKAFVVAFVILPPWIMLCLLAWSWIPVQTEPISQAPPHLARKYLHATTAKRHLTWEPDLPETATLLRMAQGNPPPKLGCAKLPSAQSLLTNTGLLTRPWGIHTKPPRWILLAHPAFSAAAYCHLSAQCHGMFV